MVKGGDYLVPVSLGVSPVSIQHAVRRRNADNLLRGREARFSAPNERVRHPETGEACYRVVRIV